MSALAAASLGGRTIVLAVTGSIAAYKAVELARLLLKAGATVLPVMTESAARFVGPVTLAGITGRPVETDMWEASGGELHVRLSEKADLHPNYIGRVERGEEHVSLIALRRIAKALGVRVRLLVKDI